MPSIGSELPREIERVGNIRDEWIRMQAQMGEHGKGMSLGIAMMKSEIDVATKALASGDVVQMMRSYETLKAYEDC